MTAFYMFRLLWLTFFGASRMDHEVEHHVHESPVSMTGVLAVLAVLSAVGGFLSIPHFLEPLLPLPAVPESLHHFEMPLLVVSVVIALAGLAGAAFFFGDGAKRAARVRAHAEGLHTVLSGKYFVDEFYERLLGRPLVWLSDRVFLRLGDRMLIDGALDGTAHLAQRGAGVLSRIQSGNLHRYLLFVLAGSAACLLWSVTRG
jgi:NADH-quinone oxidoreductase subunit L